MLHPLKDRQSPPTSCTKIKQLSVLLSTLLMPLLSYSMDLDHRSDLKVKELQPIVTSRAPASFLPEESNVVVSMEQDLWIDSLFINDDDGILQNMKEEVSSWQKTEDFNRHWNLKSTGLYEEKSDQDKKQFVQRNLLSYADKRLSGEVKKAEKGSTLATVGHVQRALKPSTSVAISEKIKFRFRARVLQRSASLVVENPYVEAYTTMSAATKRVNMIIKKNLNKVGMTVSLDYDVKDSAYTAEVSKSLAQNLSLRASSVQSINSLSWSKKSEQVTAVVYSLPF